MRYYALEPVGSIKNLKMRHGDVPAPKNETDVIIKIEAAALNYKDLVLARGVLPLDNGGAEHVPLSDGAGRIVAKGSGAIGLEIGERVVAAFFPDWRDGDPNGDERSLGHQRPGMLSEFVRLPAHALVRVPSTLNFAEAASFPCAGATAWNALVEKAALQQGDTVLTMGTGGVSMFALQIAKAMGATVVSLTGSKMKETVLKETGADHVINYRQVKDWDRAVLELTGGVGVDVVVEVGGAPTFQRSLNAVAFGGRISAVGVLAGVEGAVDPTSIIFKSVTLNGIYVGSARMLRDTMAFFDSNGLHPVLDEQRFDFEDARAAFSRLDAQQHIGKVVIDVAGSNTAKKETVAKHPTEVCAEPGSLRKQSSRK
ncbi:NAD(P)-dependent alcohol dehydrogenase [uncultured Tateyamaria sp.]|uniref:zinc-dependent alcohol dehydrogenase family protein n=1 Tax=uncultured Tateyamaria sp. TaxID=455651 RepID=UPI002633383D|nr:NAD(P)-dependent alcohol dehydrogenase [uncultured Tateyamaria sp.]